MEFSIQHAKEASFKHDGLREYFDYRDLGSHSATTGKAVMHVIKAVKGTNAHGEWHKHDVDMQLVYVLKGWAIFEYEGHGQHKLEAGTCWINPLGFGIVKSLIPMMSKFSSLSCRVISKR